MRIHFAAALVQWLCGNGGRGGLERRRCGGHARGCGRRRAAGVVRFGPGADGDVVGPRGGWCGGEAGQRPCPRGAHGVEDDEHFGGFVDHHDGGRSQDAERGERDQRADDQQREADVLQHDRAGVAGVDEVLREVAQVLTHQRDVGGLDGDVGAHGPHGDADIGGGQRGGVIDAVTDHGDPAATGDLGQQPSLVLRAQLGVDGVDARVMGERRRGAL